MRSNRWVCASLHVKERPIRWHAELLSSAPRWLTAGGWRPVRHRCIIVMRPPEVGVSSATKRVVLQTGKGAAMLSLLADPNVGFILMTVAIYGIIFELSNPGSIFPGVIGGLALILAAVSFALIAVNVAGLLLITLALVLFVADVKLPSHGALTAGGIATFVSGSLILTVGNSPSLRISITLILIVAALTAAFFLFAVGAGVRAQLRVVRTGREALVDAVGVARTELAPNGTVFVEGELWNAKAADTAIPAGGVVRVLSMNGLQLNVRAARHPEWEGME